MNLTVLNQTGRFYHPSQLPQSKICDQDSKLSNIVAVILHSSKENNREMTGGYNESL